MGNLCSVCFSESAAHILTMDSTPGGPGQLPEGLRGVIPPEDEEEVNLEGSLKRLVYIRNEKFEGFAEADATEHVVSSSFSEHKMGKVLRGKYSERADVDGAGEGAAGEASAAASKPSAKLAATRKWWSMKGPKEDEWAGAADVLEYSRRHVARVYPGGERVDSSNYDPTPLWCVGCQVVALNAQGRDKPTWRNAGKFLANGACGYVLKPHYMRQAQGKGDASAGAGWLPDAPGRARVRLRVKVLSATGYTGGWGFEGKPDLYTKLEVNGVPADCAKCQTRVIANDAAPSWNRAFAFDLAAPELAVLTLQVKESDYVNSDFMGQVALPVGELREGKLALPLLGRKGAPSARFGAPILHVEVAKEDLAQKRCVCVRARVQMCARGCAPQKCSRARRARAPQGGARTQPPHRWRRGRGRGGRGRGLHVRGVVGAVWWRLRMPHTSTKLGDTFTRSTPTHTRALPACVAPLALRGGLETALHPRARRGVRGGAVRKRLCSRGGGHL